MWSLIEMGTPCSGPTGVPVRARWSSSFWASASASSWNSSRTQLVACCAMAAALQYAVATSTAVYFFSAMAWASGMRVRPTISSSRALRMPELSRSPRRFFGSGYADFGRR